MRSRYSNRPVRLGAALFEVLVALTILATAAASVVGFANDAARTVRHARDTESEMRRASALLDAVALWPREDLDRHLGERHEGPWRLHITRLTTTLYWVVLTDSTSARELLRTAVYRPEENAIPSGTR
jgi:type II secretory pathway component PulJ